MPLVVEGQEVTEVIIQNSALLFFTVNKGVDAGCDVGFGRTLNYEPYRSFLLYLMEREVF